MNENEHISGAPAQDSSAASAAPAPASVNAGNSTSAPKPRFIVKPRYTPLPSQVEAAKKRAATDGSRAEEDALARAGFRAESEDDDGYDPYSDFHDAPERRPLFEENPWD